MKLPVFFVVVFLYFRYVKTDYTAAVVEHNPAKESTPNLTIEENVKTYIYQIEKARTLAAQIIVFPEYGLTGIGADPTNYSLEIPDVGVANYTDTFLTSLSHAAIEHQMYIVFNILEKSKNEANDTIYYNTNVVLDKNGAIAAKYRKINLYEEPKLTAGNETVTFTTDFGVTFGLFTHFDILFYHPSRSILINSTVGDIIVPQAWTSFLPFYVSLNVQSAYALANKVNLLASNLNYPSLGVGGSGIYRRDGITLRQYLSGSPSTVSLVADVQNQTDPRESLEGYGFGILDGGVQTTIANYTTPKKFAYDSYVYKTLDFTQGDISEQICDGSFCCTFNISISSVDIYNSSEIYKLMAYNGRETLGEKSFQVKLCHLVLCTSDDIKTCGDRPAGSLSTKFQNIIVTGNFENHPDHFYVPSTLKGDLQPFTNLTYLEVRNNETLTVTLNTTKIEDNVVLFGLYGRGSASTLGVSVFFVALLLVVQRMF